MVKVTEEIKQIFKILSIEVNSEQDLYSVLIPRDLLLRVDIEQQLTCLIIKLKEKYKSSKLNCLHNNRDDKQKFPGINLVRQILRCNGYHLKPVKFSRGYCKHSGKKIVDRNFKVIRLENYGEIKMAQDKVESELEKTSSETPTQTQTEPEPEPKPTTSLLVEMIESINTQSETINEPLQINEHDSEPTTNLTDINYSFTNSSEQVNIQYSSPATSSEIKEVELNF